MLGFVPIEPGRTFLAGWIFNLDQGGRTDLGSTETCRFTGSSVGTGTSKDEGLRCSQNSPFSLRPAEPPLGATLAHG